MDLVQFVSFLMVVVILMWFVYKYIPMNRKIRQVLTIVLAVIVALWIANFFDVFNFLEGFHFGS